MDQSLNCSIILDMDLKYFWWNKDFRMGSFFCHTLCVRPHLDYGDVIYHNQHTSSMKLLKKIQYQAGLIVTNCLRGTSRVKLYKDLRWESLAQRRTGRRLALYHKIINNHTPPI